MSVTIMNAIMEKRAIMSGRSKVSESSSKQRLATHH